MKDPNTAGTVMAFVGEIMRKSGKGIVMNDMTGRRIL